MYPLWHVYAGDDEHIQNDSCVKQTQRRERELTGKRSSLGKRNHGFIHLKLEIADAISSLK